MEIIGTAEDARNLAKGIFTTTLNIYNLTKGIAEQLKILQNTFQDNGFDEYENIVMSLFISIHNHLDDIGDLKGSLEKYAQILESKD